MIPRRRDLTQFERQGTPSRRSSRLPFRRAEPRVAHKVRKDDEEAEEEGAEEDEEEEEDGEKEDEGKDDEEKEDEEMPNLFQPTDKDAEDDGYMHIDDEDVCNPRLPAVPPISVFPPSGEPALGRSFLLSILRHHRLTMSSTVPVAPSPTRKEAKRETKVGGDDR